MIVDHRKAEAAAAGPSKAKPAFLAMAEASRQQLALAPFGAGAMVDLAQAEVASGSDPEGEPARILLKSYQYDPTDSALALRRILLVLSDWGKMPADLLDQANKELTAICDKDVSACQGIRAQARQAIFGGDKPDAKP